MLNDLRNRASVPRRIRPGVRALLASLLFAAPACTGAPSTERAPARAVAPRPPLRADEEATIRLFRESGESVVYITTLVRRRDVFTLNILEIPQGTGSGFVWDENGHIVTNFHVIRDADVAQVTLADGSSFDARVVGIAPDKDLAVLRIDAGKRKLKPIPVGGSSDLLVGQSVFAIGNPFGLDQTLTTGVISALDREIESLSRRPITGVIQTDAAINPGNSGGPLLDSAGRLIGVNTQIYSPSGAFAGVGFAVPVDTVNRVVPQLVAHGKLIRPGLGIRIAHDMVARRFGLEGVLIVEVVPGGAGEKAGLRGTTRDRYDDLHLGDVIVALDGKAVATNNDLFKLLDEHEVGDAVPLTVLRGGAKRALRVTLEPID